MKSHRESTRISHILKLYAVGGDISIRVVMPVIEKARNMAAYHHYVYVPMADGSRSSCGILAAHISPRYHVPSPYLVNAPALKVRREMRRRRLFMLAILATAVAGELARMSASLVHLDAVSRVCRRQKVPVSNWYLLSFTAEEWRRHAEKLAAK